MFLQYDLFQDQGHQGSASVRKKRNLFRPGILYIKSDDTSDSAGETRRKQEVRTEFMKLWDKRWIKKEKLRIWIRDRKNRAAASLLASLLAVSCMAGSIKPPACTEIQGWWGAIYPEFCFAQAKEESREQSQERDTEESRPKISFWLAKVLDW